MYEFISIASGLFMPVICAKFEQIVITAHCYRAIVVSRKIYLTFYYTDEVGLRIVDVR